MLRIARMAGLGKLHRSDWRAGQSPLWAVHPIKVALLPGLCKGHYLRFADLDAKPFQNHLTTIPRTPYPRLSRWRLQVPIPSPGIPSAIQSMAR
jgi:hypothetical protein